MMGHDNLGNHFQTNFGLVQHHKWSLSDLEAMMPWERYVYVDLLNAHIREEDEKAKDRENQQKAYLNQLNRRRM